MDVAFSITGRKIAEADSQMYVDANGELQIIPLIANQGGTSSGKTYGTLQHLIFKYGLYAKRNYTIDIFRKYAVDLEGTVIEDFLNILDTYGLYRRANHTKTPGKISYTIHSLKNPNVKTTFYFKGLDDKTSKVKKRGRRRDIAYFNEINDFSLDDYLQISSRTRIKCFVDFNPSEEFWLHEKYFDHEDRQAGKDFILIKTTYLDNVNVDTGITFLPQKQIQEIEDLIKIDDYYYKVYVLGELAQAKGLIYDDKLWKIISDDVFDSIQPYECEEWYGVDWGYEHYMTMIHFKYYKEKLYEKLIYCEKGQHDTDLLRFIDEEYIGEDGFSLVNQASEIYCDHAYPASIKTLKNGGYNARKADKTVDAGIRHCQKITRYITESSRQLNKERKRYKWKQDSDEKVHVGTPVKKDDDCMDAERYGLYTHSKRNGLFGIELD